MIQATAVTLMAAALAALAFAALSLLWFVVGVLLCGAFALVGEVLARRNAARMKR